MNDVNQDPENPHLNAALRGISNLIQRIIDDELCDRHVTREYIGSLQMQIREYKKMAVLEIKLLDKEQQKVVSHRLTDLIRQYKEKLNELEGNIQAVELTDNIDKDEPNVLEDRQILLEEIRGRADKAQDETQGALSRMQQYAQDAEEIAQLTDMQMGKQIEQLERLDDGYKKIDENTSKAQMTMKYFAHRWCKSKCIRILFILDTCLFAIIILIMTCWN